MAEGAWWKSDAKDEQGVKKLVMENLSQYSI